MSIRRLWNGTVPILSTNLINAGIVDVSFNIKLTQAAIAAVYEFEGEKPSLFKPTVDDTGGSRRRRRKQTSPINESPMDLDNAHEARSTSNNNFFEHQRLHGYKFAFPSIANCEQVQQLEEEFFHASINYLKALDSSKIANQLENDGGEFSIDLWAAIQRGKGAHHAFHVHEGAVISGVYYSACPLGCAPLVLRRPTDCTHASDSLEIREDDQILQPKEGDLVLFPPWLEHGVPHAAGEDHDKTRVSWPFNLNARLAIIGNPWDITRQWP